MSLQRGCSGGVQAVDARHLHGQDHPAVAGSAKSRQVSNEQRGCAQEGGLLDRLLAGASNPASPSTREDALQGLRALAEGGGAAAERHLLRALPVLLERQGDKARPG